ncbi:hypothetical protein [Microbacterium sp. SORGH_AS_0421]|uniref:hypothetical protein n=1 Tax=Microbacterium sp. SORGH_AS_0421 TaxID=3041768 RepID=UPI00278E084C|nr:hypothetical protein [Microbacterium sp. SORGH_AS_0421]MDQ1175424.1 hypothetical protein [Microbacterium sp. SORGH_AS_0421]
MMFGKRQRHEAQQSREVLRQEVSAAGWTWEGAAPAPIFEFGEAVLRGSRSHDIWMVGVADALRGTVGEGDFQAGRLVAGFGVFSRRTIGGAGLRPEQRLVRPDWKGYGLGGKVPWPQASDAPKHVTMSRRKAVDVWDVPPGTSSGLYIGTRAGGSDLPAVASALHHGV